MELADLRGQSESLMSLGDIYKSQQQLDRAIDCYQQHLTIPLQFPDRSQCESLDSLGYIYKSQQQWDEAILCYQQSTEIRQELGDRTGEAQTWGKLGSVYNISAV
jgi:tetratricopeptide (TPR) repeat protein